jgi:hypothetical protein
VLLSDQLSLLGARLGFFPESPRFGAKDALTLRGVAATTNSFINEPGYQIDEEFRTFQLSADYAVSDDLTLLARVPVLWRGGGVLDGVIDDWHRVFSLPRGGREVVADDQYFIGGITDDGDVFDLDANGLGLGNIATGARYKLFRSADDGTTVALQSLLSLPTAEGSLGHEGIDLSLGLIAERPFGSFYLTVGGALLGRSDDSIDTIEYADIVGSGFVYLEWLVSERWSLGVGLQGSTRQIDSIVGFPEHTLYLDTSVGYRLSAHQSLQVLVRENPSPQEGSADVTFALQYQHEIGW